jgi:hypothetical protein
MRSVTPPQGQGLRRSPGQEDSDHGVHRPVTDLPIAFATYHLHMPWAIPTVLLDTFALSYPSRRYRSALIGIAVHSAQSVVVVAVTLSLVLQ